MSHPDRRSGRRFSTRRGVFSSVGLAIGALCFASCGVSDPGIEQAALRIDAESLAQGIQDLSADSMGGRAPSSLGEERTVRYLTDRFEQLGLGPATAGRRTWRSFLLPPIQVLEHGSAVGER